MSTSKVTNSTSHQMEHSPHPGVDFHRTRAGALYPETGTLTISPMQEKRMRDLRVEVAMAHSERDRVRNERDSWMRRKVAAERTTDRRWRGSTIFMVVCFAFAAGMIGGILTTGSVTAQMPCSEVQGE